MENEKTDQGTFLDTQQESYLQFHKTFLGLRGRIESSGEETDYQELDADITAMRKAVDQRCKEIRAFQEDHQIEASVDAGLENLVALYDKIFTELGTLYFQHIHQHLQ